VLAVQPARLSARCFTADANRVKFVFFAKILMFRKKTNACYAVACFYCSLQIKKSASKKTFETENIRGTTQIAYIKICHLSGSNKPYAFTQQSREEPTHTSYRNALEPPAQKP
jgi:hypothetical protein